MIVLKFKVGACEWILPGAGKGSIRLAKALGIDGLQLGFLSYDDGYPLFHRWFREMYMELSAEYSIELPSLAMCVYDIYGLKNPKNSKKGKIVYKTIDRSIEAACHMKMHMIMMPSFKDGLINDRYELERTADALRYACDVAKDAEIIITSENLLNTKEQMELISMVDRKNFALFYDFENYTVFRQWDSLKLLKNLYSFIYPEMHVKDGIDGVSSCMPIGEGHGRFAEIMEYLKRMKFTGWLHIENRYTKLQLRNLSPNDLISLVKRDVQTIIGASRK
jgi:sugar phosphate isomerase/epimerase